MGPWLDGMVTASRRIAAEAQAVLPSVRERPDDIVVNVHDHAWAPYEAFLRQYYGRGGPRVLCLSMNPGPNGAVQTGIPFTDTATARRLLPDFDALVERPTNIRSDREEQSGRKLQAWARAEFGGLDGMYKEILFAFAFPIGILRGPKRLNVPLPGLRGTARRAADAFYESSAALLAAAARPTGLFLLGSYAAERWSRVRSDPAFAGIPWIATHHPAARISNAHKLRDWSRAWRTLRRKVHTRRVGKG